MRKVVKNLQDIPNALVKPETLDNLKVILQTRDSKKISSDFYRGKYDKPDGKKGDEVIEKLENFYFKKCAYCEDYAMIYIEHYRPKGRVIKTKHGGYFWLCYEWSNLLPSCHECNKIGGGKGDQFPVKHNHTKFEDCLINQDLDPDKIQAEYLNDLEKPFLLNPEIDEPEHFLGFELKHGGVALKGLDGNDGRGEQTIKICNLNRDSLIISRQDVITDFIKRIDLALNFCKNNQYDVKTTILTIHIVFERVTSESKDLEKDFTLLRKYFIENPLNFEHLVISQLPNNDKEIIKLAFNLYKNGKL